MKKPETYEDILCLKNFSVVGNKKKIITQKESNISAMINEIKKALSFQPLNLSWIIPH